MDYIIGKNLRSLGLMYVPAFVFYSVVAIVSIAIGYS